MYKYPKEAKVGLKQRKLKREQSSKQVIWNTRSTSLVSDRNREQSFALRKRIWRQIQTQGNFGRLRHKMEQFKNEIPKIQTSIPFTERGV